MEFDETLEGACSLATTIEESLADVDQHRRKDRFLPREVAIERGTG